MLEIPRLNENDPVRARLLVTRKQLGRTREGKPYLRLRLANRSGSIEALVWDDAERVYRSLSGTSYPVVDVQGVVTLYQNERRIRLSDLTVLPEGEADLDDFLPRSPRPPEEMAEELHGTIRKVKNPFLRRLLEGVFRDPEIWDRFRAAPAAKMMHHAYRGGLLEHTLSLAGLARLASRHYPFLDGDLLLAGALLHDLGKAWEISPEPGFDYTDEGRLLGHILIGYRVLEAKIEAIPDFPPSLALNLKHLLASHHGEPQFGSPKTPMTLEAFCLHALDDLDAKLHGIHAFLREEAAPERRWTAFHRVHQQYFYIPEFLREGETSPTKETRGGEEEEPPGLFSDAIGTMPEGKGEKP